MKTKLLWWLSVVLTLVIGAKLYYVLTDDFNVNNITSNLPSNPQWEIVPLPAEKLQNVESILNQKFHYLGKGCQSYVLVSDDQQYVLKFFKFKHLHQNRWLDNIPLPKFLEDKRAASLKRRQDKLNLLFTGAKIAYEKIPEETGVIFIHLNKTPFLTDGTIHFTDKLGFSHTIDLNNTEFILQRKADLIHPTIDRLAQEGNLDAIKTLFHHMLNTLVSRSQKSVADKDPAMIQNLGILQNKAIILDVGQLVLDPQISDPQSYKADIRKRSREFEEWLQDHHPQLLKVYLSVLDSL